MAGSVLLALSQHKHQALFLDVKGPSPEIERG
jgi:hypothetical protein